MSDEEVRRLRREADADPRDARAWRRSCEGRTNRTAPWTRETGAGRSTWGGLTDDRDVVARLGRSDGALACLSASDGTTRWRTDLPGWAIAFVGDRVLTVDRMGAMGPNTDEYAATFVDRTTGAVSGPIAFTPGAGAVHSDVASDVLYRSWFHGVDASSLDGRLLWSWSARTGPAPLKILPGRLRGVPRGGRPRRASTSGAEEGAPDATRLSDGPLYLVRLVAQAWSSGGSGG